MDIVVITIESISTPGVFLRMDGAPRKDGSPAVVNCQYGAGPFERFIFRTARDGYALFESGEFPGVYLTMEIDFPPRVIGARHPDPLPELTLVSQAGASGLETQISFSSGFSLQMNSQGVRQANDNGFGVVNVASSGPLTRFKVNFLPENEQRPVALTESQLNEIIAKVGPRVYFHPEETFNMCSVDWFLAHSKLSHEGKQVAAPVSVSNLPQGATDDGKYELRLNDDAKHGALGTARAYVRAVRRANGKTDLQFYLCYAYNGPGFGGVEQLAAGINTSSAGGPGVSTAPMGEHYGDWECCILRVDNVTAKVEGIYLTRHGDVFAYEGLQLNDIQRDQNGKIVLYASLNGHAMFNKPGNFPTVVKDLTEKGNGIRALSINRVAAGGKSLDCAKSFEIASADWLGIVQPWVNFPYRWGLQNGVQLEMPLSAAHAMVTDGAGKVFDWINTAYSYTVAGGILSYFGLSPSTSVEALIQKASTEDNSGPHGPKQQDIELWNGLKN